MVERRQFLAGLGGAVAAATAGCVSAGTSEECRADPTHPSNGVRLVNEREAPVRVTVAVRQEVVVAAPVVFERSYDLPAFGEDGAIVLVPGVVDTAGPHVVEVTVGGGEPAKQFWQVTADSCNSVEVVVGEEVRFPDVG